MVGGRWSVVGGRWSVVGGRWSVVGGRWSVVGGRLVEVVEVVGGVAAGVDGMEVGQTFVEVDPVDRQRSLDEAGDVQRPTERPVLRLLRLLRLLRHRVTVHRHSCHGATPPRIRTAHLL